MQALLTDAETATDREALLAFTDKWLKSYQIPSEIFALIDSLNQLQPKNFMEIGMCDGGTHFLIRKLCPSIRESVAVDPDIRNKTIIERLSSTEKAHYLVGLSTDKRIRKEISQIYSEPGCLDVLFIDGDHSYQGARSDYLLYQDLVRSGGYIVFHDIVEDWGQRYGKPTNKYTGGVPQLFAELKVDYQHMEFVEDSEQDGFGIGVLVQP